MRIRSKAFRNREVIDAKKFNRQHPTRGELSQRPVPKFQSLTRISVRFFAALLGLGLLAYLVFRAGPGVVWKQVLRWRHSVQTLGDRRKDPDRGRLC